MLSNISNKDKKKFDVALVNSYVVYWYMKNMDNTYDSYMDRINNYLEWMVNRPSEKVAYNAMKFVKEFINKHKLTDEFLRYYCSELEHNNPRQKWNKQYRRQTMTVAELIDLLQDLPKDAEVGKIVTRSIGVRDDYEDVFKSFKKMDYKVEFNKGNPVKRVIIEQIMTVAELIEVLKDIPQDYEVTFVDTHMQEYRSYRVKEVYVYDEITKEVEIELKHK